MPFTGSGGTRWPSSSPRGGWHARRATPNPSGWRMRASCTRWGSGAAASVDPEWVAAWLSEESQERKRALERRTFGVELTSLGRTLAERWGCDPLIVDASWLYGDRDGGLGRLASDPAPGADPGGVHLGGADPLVALWEHLERARFRRAALRVLIAEVQVRCGSAFVDHDATVHEERLARENARLRIEVSKLHEGLAEHATAFFRLSARLTRPRAPRCGPSARAGRGAASRGSPPRGCSGMSPVRRLRRRRNGVPRGSSPWENGCRPPPRSTSGPRGQRPRGALVRGSGRLAYLGRPRGRSRRTRQPARRALRAYREQVEQGEPKLRQAKLDALAEFAAGAGHELNNPLAVIVGRAQLLLTNEADPGRLRSLRAIIVQAQRAHRILRDLMFVARVPEPRPRICQPDEIVRGACATSRPTPRPAASGSRSTAPSRTAVPGPTTTPCASCWKRCSAMRSRPRRRVARFRSRPPATRRTCAGLSRTMAGASAPRKANTSSIPSIAGARRGAVGSGPAPRREARLPGGGRIALALRPRTGFDVPRPSAPQRASEATSRVHPGRPRSRRRTGPSLLEPRRQTGQGRGAGLRSSMS